MTIQEQELAAQEKLPTDVETAWLNIQNLDDKNKLKISVCVNGDAFEKVLFNRDPAIDQNNIGESHNITWLVKNSYDLAIAHFEITELQATIERQTALLKASDDEWGEKAEFLSPADQAIRDYLKQDKAAK